MRMSRWSRWPLTLCLLLVVSFGSATAPTGQYSFTATTVTDNKTQLVWQRVEDGNTYTWAAAKTHCTGLNAVAFGGFSSGWRLPTVKELQTIVDDKVMAGPTIDSVFTGTVANLYWSTTPVSSSPSFAWYVNFLDGRTNSDAEGDNSHVRCVR